MTAFNTSFLSSSAYAASRVGKKGYRSSKSNNSYIVDVFDFDNEVSTYDVEAESASEQSAPEAKQAAERIGKAV